MKKSFLFIAAIAALCACSKEEVDLTPDFSNIKLAPGEAMIVAHSTAASTSATKTALGDVDGTNQAVVWSAGDQIKVSDGTNYYTYDLASAAGSVDAAFSGSDKLSKDAGLFCAYSATSFGATTASFACPTPQSESTISTSGSMAMIGKSTATAGEVSFKQVYGLIKFLIKDSNWGNQSRAKLASLTISTDENYFTTVNYTFNGSDYSIAGTDGNGDLVFNFANEEIDNTTALECYMIVPANIDGLSTYTAKFTFTYAVVNKKGQAVDNSNTTTTFTKTINIQPGHVKTVNVDLKH